jgi:hypothetical protein
MRHFTWPGRVLTSGISSNPKKCQKPEISRIMALFSDLQNSTCKYPYRPWKVPPFLMPRHSHRDPRSHILKYLRQFACLLGYLKVPESLGSPDSGTFFRFGNSTFKYLCSTRLWYTSEDECKWFIAIWFILLKLSKQDGEIFWIWCHGTLLLFTRKMALFTVITYSVHDGSSLSLRSLLPVFLIAPWGCCPLLCWWSTAYLAPRLEGRALPQPPHGVTPIPSGSRHLPASSSATVPLQAMWSAAFFFLQVLCRAVCE